MKICSEFFFLLQLYPDFGPGGLKPRGPDLLYLGDIYDNIGGEILIMTQYDLIFYPKHCSG